MVMVCVVTNHIMVIELKVVVKATTFFYYVLYKNQNLARIIHDRIFCRHGSWLWFVVMVRVVTNHIFKPHIHYNYLFQSPKNIFLPHKK